MKNIMLIGVSRSGKSTFAKMLKSKYPEYNIIHGDMIKKAYENNFECNENLRDIKEYRLFIKDIFTYEHTINKMNYILDTVDIYPSDINDNDRENTIILAFGYSNITAEELVDIWKNIDSEWLKNKSDEFLIEKARKGLKKSEYFKEECKKYGIKYINTTRNRNKIFQELLNEI